MYFLAIIRNGILKLKLLVILTHNGIAIDLNNLLLNRLAIVVEEPLVILIPHIVGDPTV